MTINQMTEIREEGHDLQLPKYNRYRSLSDFSLFREKIRVGLMANHRQYALVDRFRFKDQGRSNNILRSVRIEDAFWGSDHSTNAFQKKKINPLHEEGLRYSRITPLSWLTFAPSRCFARTDILRSRVPGSVLSGA